MEFESVIGLEVHAQLTTKTKIFCGSSTEYGHAPNELTDPVTLGLPGSLPVLNRQVVEFSIMLGLALNCEIRRFNRFARKHYFYPDLPKGYQISQYEEPICERGSLDVEIEGATRTIGIRRIHMEEDAGKNIHDSRTHSSLVDLNRAGVALLEIVSQPDLRTPAEAAAYLKTLRQMLLFLNICEGNMEEGNLRCDANVSVRPRGETKLGTRTELKNINSFKFVERALEYEIARQIALVRSGDSVVQETRLYDSLSGTTASMRSKEESADYRYFPDPDLPPLIIEQSWVEEIRSRMPILPNAAKKKLVEVYGLQDYDAGVLTSDRTFVEFFERVFEVSANARSACNWITSELFGALNREGIDFKKSPISADNLGQLIKLVDSEVISGKMAKSVFEEMFSTSKSPETIVSEKGLRQVTDTATIQAIVDKVLEQSTEQLVRYFAGNDKLFGFFIGQVMKASGGNLSPKIVNELVTKALEKRRPA